MVSKKKLLNLGIGFSKKKEAYAAAVEAAQMALKKTPKAKFSVVYTNSMYDQKEFLKGVNKVLGKNWVGISTDKIFNSETGFDPELTISILSFDTQYMHFNVSVADNYRKNPFEKGKKAAMEAVSGAKGDKYVDAYIQFHRTKKKDYGNIIKNPPYFMLSFISGVKAKKGKITPGNEVEFVSGLLDYTGPHIPVFGGSASSDLDQYFDEKADNWQFANGKMYHDAAIVVFVICNLHFATMVSHGYKATDKFAVVTDLDKTGYEILKLNGKEPVAEYARLIGVSKQKYLKEKDKYSYACPLGMVQHDGTTYVREAVPNPDKKTLHSTLKLHKNSILNVLQLDKREIVRTSANAIQKMKKQKGKEPALALFCSCSGRRPVLKGIEKKDFKQLKKSYPKLPVFGFYSFSEIGSTRTNSARSHSQTITSLVIFDKLLSE